MNLTAITAVCDELRSVLVGRRFGKIFQLSKSEIAVDFHLPRYLFISLAPVGPGAYLIKRRLRDLEKTSGNPSNFSLQLRKALSGAEMTAVEQAPGERVLIFSFDAIDELEQPVSYKLAAQLTGVSANLFLLDAESTIIETAKQTRGPGQQVGDAYTPPTRSAAHAESIETKFSGESISQHLDEEAQERSAANSYTSLANAARAKLKQEIGKREKLVKRLNEDLAGHGDAEKWKRYGDLLLANSSNARRAGVKIWVTDYFDERAPEIAIEIDENDSTTEAAEKFFKRYTKARNAGQEIEKRLLTIGKELVRLKGESEVLESAIATGDEEQLTALTGVKNEPASRKTGRQDPKAIPGVRSFVSSDGFEILVGKKAKDNDFLTFRIAKSLDTWMHAADYPGSHVVIRNPNRKEIPPKTLVEAAELAAFYSQGKTQPKAAVHYTQKKFVNKPRGSAPGLVSLASFKTVLVEPKVGAGLMLNG